VFAVADFAKESHARNSPDFEIFICGTEKSSGCAEHGYKSIDANMIRDDLIYQIYC
jgi:hypothetical protein